MNPDIISYNNQQAAEVKPVCDWLMTTIDTQLCEAESKIWHAHPVWFLEGNPVVGYSVTKHGVRLLFWSGQSFDEPALAQEGTFKAAGINCTQVSAIHQKDLERWLEKARTIQWDYKNLVKRKGVLERLA